jgi:phage tail tape-measure protein
MTLKELHEKLRKKELTTGFDDERNLTWEDIVVEGSDGCVIDRNWTDRDGGHVDVEDVTFEYQDLLDEMNSKENISESILNSYQTILSEMDKFLDELKKEVRQVETSKFSEKYELKRDAMSAMFDKITEMKIAIKFIGEQNNGFDLLTEEDFQHMIKSLGVPMEKPTKNKVIN